MSLYRYYMSPHLHSVEDGGLDVLEPPHVLPLDVGDLGCAHGRRRALLHAVQAALQVLGKQGEKGGVRAPLCA